MTRKAKPKGIRHPPQRRGRALKPGARYPSGKLKVATPVDDSQPNERVVSLRRVMLGAQHGKLSELTAAENPLDLALACKVITQQEHRAGEMLQAAYRRSGYDLPSLRTQDLAREVRGTSSATGDPVAMTDLRECAKRLRCWPKASRELFSVCVLGEWPPWMIVGPPTRDASIARVLFVQGLRIIAPQFGCGEAVEEQRRAG